MPRGSSPGRELDPIKLRRIKEGNKQRKEDEKNREVGREEEAAKAQEWEDSMVTTLEYMLNCLIAFVAASLPASETPPDYISSVVVLVANGLLNLMFRSTWIDRFILYSMNLILPVSGEMIRRIDEIPGKMPPFHWFFFIMSNSVMIAFGWWYYIRKCKASESEFRQNVIAIAILAVNIVVGVLLDVISIYHVLRWLNLLKNVFLKWTISPN
eukprot:TRINITY_DN1118_c3_g1_i1.p1 TRINITY_DN1118_c3_g1~~TRINITY_DN1118_c3_g1_i1.p1  ORF type:complete len:227 (+),score=32.33 TRINITY_DN1118_c3_g1_i1:46-681(+)